MAVSTQCGAVQTDCESSQEQVTESLELSESAPARASIPARPDLKPRCSLSNLALNKHQLKLQDLSTLLKKFLRHESSLSYAPILINVSEKFCD